MKKRCFIAGAGEYCGSFNPSEDDFIIAADGGFAELISRGIMPDLVVGDFDSLGSVPDHPNILLTPAEKDDTDMMTAVKEGLSLGFKEFIIDGGLGGRLDHSYANFQLLAYLTQRESRGYLLGDAMTITAISNESISFVPSAAGFVSIFCAGSIADGVSIKGLKYPLENAALTCNYPLGVSNEFTGASATVAVNNGILLIMWTGGLEAIKGYRSKQAIDMEEHNDF